MDGAYCLDMDSVYTKEAWNEVLSKSATNDVEEIVYKAAWEDWVQGSDGAIRGPAQFPRYETPTFGRGR